MKPEALRLEIVARCSTTRARVAKLHLPQYTAETPMFMAVGTQGTVKGLTPAQLEAAGCQVILGNTYHLALRPGPELLDSAGGLHRWMGWRQGLLTDSGGFQMVSLVELSQVTEEGVCFRSPRDGAPMLLTPERSIEIQNAIGADIIMQLDDVVSSLASGPRVQEAMERSVRWLDRCISAHGKPGRQSLFAIIQGGLDLELRRQCIAEMVKRGTPGYAIGGLSGGESKDAFWRVVAACTAELPDEKPRYCMGVGYAEDLIVCSALGADMYDCVFPTRTARFGTALTNRGPLCLRRRVFAADSRPLEPGCPCATCAKHSRSELFHLLQSRETVACHLVSVHNLTFQMQLMTRVRAAIVADNFPEFVKFWMRVYYKERWPESRDMSLMHEASCDDRSAAQRKLERARGADDANGDSASPKLSRTRESPPPPIEWERGYPAWIVRALSSVGVELD